MTRLAMVASSSEIARPDPATSRLNTAVTWNE
jgi:hypothetical protein